MTSQITQGKARGSEKFTHKFNQTFKELSIPILTK
jgi:hypothetical protein